MTREEQAQYIAEKLMENPEFRKAFAGAITDAANEVVKAIKALGGEYIKVPKGALKYRTAGMVAYNAEWLKKHFDTERAVICGAQQPCDDTISRQAAIDALDCINGVEEVLKSLPPAEPERKIGKWITVDRDLMVTSYKCSECGRTVRDDTGYDVIRDYPYCHCGAKMQEV